MSSGVLTTVSVWSLALTVMAFIKSVLLFAFLSVEKRGTLGGTCQLTIDCIPSKGINTQ